MGVSVGLGFRAVYVADARRKRRALTGTLFRFDVVQARAIGVSAARVNPRRSRRGWAQGCMCERSEVLILPRPSHHSPFVDCTACGNPAQFHDPLRTRRASLLRVSFTWRLGGVVVD